MRLLWIGVILYLLPMGLVLFLKRHPFSYTSTFSRAETPRRERILFIVGKNIMLAFFLTSFFVPLSPTPWIAGIGIVLFIGAYIVTLAGWYTIFRTPRNTLYTTGPYRFSRHPLYVSTLVVFTGMGVASGCIGYLILGLAAGILHARGALQEERVCEGIFGDTYRQFRNRTPRWLGLPGSS